jgi:hypothetical protein
MVELEDLLSGAKKVLDAGQKKAKELAQQAGITTDDRTAELDKMLSITQDETLKGDIIIKYVENGWTANPGYLQQAADIYKAKGMQEKADGIEATLAQKKEAAEKYQAAKAQIKDVVVGMSISLSEILGGLGEDIKGFTEEAGPVVGEYLQMGRAAADELVTKVKGSMDKSIDSYVTNGDYTCAAIMASLNHDPRKAEYAAEAYKGFETKRDFSGGRALAIALGDMEKARYFKQMSDMFKKE